jgi:hypothetical protein
MSPLETIKVTESASMRPMLVNVTTPLQYIAALGWMQWFAPASRRRGFAPDLDKAQERMSKARHTFLPSGVERKRRILARGRLRNA